MFNSASSISKTISWISVSKNSQKPSSSCLAAICFINVPACQFGFKNLLVAFVKIGNDGSRVRQIAAQGILSSWCAVARRSGRAYFHRRISAIPKTGGRLQHNSSTVNKIHYFQLSKSFKPIMPSEISDGPSLMCHHLLQELFGTLVFRIGKNSSGVSSSRIWPLSTKITGRRLRAQNPSHGSHTSWSCRFPPSLSSLSILRRPFQDQVREVGSSNNITRGSIAKPRAIATRCC